ncbi:MAG: hypothetical protein WC997_06230 [Porticoccaceae bacterium]
MLSLPGRMALVLVLAAAAMTTARGGDWDDFARIRHGAPPVHENVAELTQRPSQSDAADTQPSPARAGRKGPTAQLGEPLVYTRVPRTRGRYVVTLRDGSPYTLESPDVWDTLPDSRLVFEGFNAPGQLVLRQPDGSETILFDCLQSAVPCVPLDPAVSLDGRKVLFSVYRGAELRAAQWNGTTLPNRQLAAATEAQLYVVDLGSGAVKPLAHTPGVFDVSPAWLPDGRIMFASTRANIEQPWLNRITPNKRKEPQIFISAADGSGAVNITPHEISTAMHPYVLSTGRVAYSSQWLSHNLAYGTTNGGINWPGTLDNMWLVMDMDLRGGDMTALLGAHRADVRSAKGRRHTMKALHFLGERRNGDICVSNYYRANNLGLGDVFCWAPEPVGVEGELPRFLPRKLYNVANWSQSNDEPSFRDNGIYQGKIGYPEGMEGNQLVLTVGRGFCTRVSGSVRSFQERVAGQPEKRACDVGLYATTRIPSRSMSDLALIVDREDWHEFGARVVVARSIATPALSASGDGSCQLVSSDAGTAETAPYRPYKFNANYKTTANNGGEIAGIDHAELAAIRFWQVEPNTSNRRTLKNSIGNPLRLLGDVALLADNSFKVSLPCDTPFLMAGLDSRGRVIKRDQVPQSLRPGEKRICQGCHLHSRKGRPYEKSLAFSAPPVVLAQARKVPNYEEDIRPIFARHCTQCHRDDVPLMDYKKLVWDYFQQAVPPEKRVQVSKSENERRRWGLHRPYTSKYVNSMFARESLLYWKAANERSDGRDDATYDNDIDFGADHPTTISASELKLLAEWLDSGATSLMEDH